MNLQVSVRRAVSVMVLATLLLALFGTPAPAGALPGTIQDRPGVTGSKPPTVGPGGTSGAAAGAYHSCTVLSSGTVRCWGRNEYGQLGDATTTESPTPVTAIGLRRNATTVETSWNHTCALINGGGARCWGWNFYGQVGDGSTMDHHKPVDVDGLGSGTTGIAGGSGHTCALLEGGGVKCWGSNFFGQVGDGTTTERHTPVEVVGLASGATAIAAGATHSCALNGVGGVMCWGWNQYGQVGDGTTKNRATPVEVTGLGSGVAAIAGGGSHTCALLETGAVKCWGWNLFGQLGDGTTSNQPTPVDVQDLTSGVVAIAAGATHTCALLDGGGVKCWGRNNDGQLGDGTNDDRHTPMDVSGLQADVVEITGGWAHTCAKLADGSVKCWGYNGYGELGDGTTTDRLTPVDVVGLEEDFQVYLPLVALDAVATAGLE